MQKNVIIVGASSGIGFELARRYLANGDRVGITGRRQHLLDLLKSQFPGCVETACFDVMGNENIAQLKGLVAKLGGLDLLIYNSGYGEISETLDWEIDRRTTLTNVNGFLEIVHYAYNYFVAIGKGQVAATSSIASIRESSQAPAYSASKAYMSRYMAGLHLKARKLRKATGAGIYVSDIQPGFVKTKMAEGKGRLWEAPVEKAADQIFKAIQKKKRKTYITRRWALIAALLKWMPYFVVKRIA